MSCAYTTIILQFSSEQKNQIKVNQSVWEKVWKEQLFFSHCITPKDNKEYKCALKYLHFYLLNFTNMRTYRLGALLNKNNKKKLLK